MYFVVSVLIVVTTKFTFSFQQRVNCEGPKYTKNKSIKFIQIFFYTVNFIEYFIFKKCGFFALFVQDIAKDDKIKIVFNNFLRNKKFISLLSTNSAWPNRSLEPSVK